MLKVKGHGELRGDEVFWKFFKRVEDEDGNVNLEVIFFREGFSDCYGVHLRGFEVGDVFHKSMLGYLSVCEIYHVSENNDNVFIFVDDDGSILVAKDVNHEGE